VYYVASPRNFGGEEIREARKNWASSENKTHVGICRKNQVERGRRQRDLRRRGRLRKGTRRCVRGVRIRVHLPS